MSANDRAGLQARRLAVELINELIGYRRPLDDAFERLLAQERYAGLEPRDRAFARSIVMMALRRKGQLLAIIKSFVDKPLPEKRGGLDAILLCSAAQLVFLKIPPHAVINLAVFQVREDTNARRFAKLANAVLRRISEQGAAIALSQDAARLNTPDWLWESWNAAFGPDEASRIANQHMQEPPLDLTVKRDTQDWAEKLGGIVLPTGGVRIKAKGRIEDIEGFASGEWWVQDAAASLPALLLGDVRGKRVADLCAAPGGKTAQLACRGALVTAVDLSAKRLKRLGENLQRLALKVETVEADLRDWTPEDSFDAVLLDAPCSATGTIRRNPDIAYLKTPSDIAELVRLQQMLLANAIKLLKPGGMLVYCTCSLQSEEATEQIARLLAERNDVALRPVGPEEIGGRAEWLDNDGSLRTLPHDLQLSDPDLSGMDGFYAARLVKRGDVDSP